MSRSLEVQHSPYSDEVLFLVVSNREIIATARKMGKDISAVREEEFCLTLAHELEQKTKFNLEWLAYEIVEKFIRPREMGRRAALMKLKQAPPITFMDSLAEALLSFAKSEGLPVARVVKQ